MSPASTPSNLVVIGSSAGGLRALQTVLGGLPAGFPWPLAVVQHRGKESGTGLVESLQKHCCIPVAEALDKEHLIAGRVFICPPNYHLLVDGPLFSLSTDPLVSFARPSVDVLFESAADAFGPNAIGVVLTGANDDGATGAALIAAAGGRVLVQDPQTAENPSMPRAALARAVHAEAVPLAQIARRLCEFAGILPAVDSSSKPPP